MDTHEMNAGVAPMRLTRPPRDHARRRMERATHHVWCSCGLGTLATAEAARALAVEHSEQGHSVEVATRYGGLEDET